MTLVTTSPRPEMTEERTEGDGVFVVFFRTGHGVGNLFTDNGSKFLKDGHLGCISSGSQPFIESDQMTRDRLGCFVQSTFHTKTQDL